MTALIGTICFMVIFCAFLSSADFFFKINFFEKIILGVSSECQTVWIQIRHVILSDLIRIHTVSKGCQQTTLVGKELIFRLSKQSY